MIENLINRYKGIDSLLIAKNGKLIYESYFNDGAINKPHHMASLGKSFLSALVGIALEKGILTSVEQNITHLLPLREYLDLELDKNKKNIKLKNFLTMSSGLQCGNIKNYQTHCGFEMQTKEKPIRWLMSLPMQFKPGSQFQYNDASPQVVAAIINYRSGQNISDFAEQYLVKPLGLSRNVFLDGKATSRDMLKFGLLYLQQGKYNGLQIVSRKWIESSTTPQYFFNQKSNLLGYGFYWWVKVFKVGDATVLGYYGAGNGGQYIFVFPEINMVIVMTGSNYNNLTETRHSIELTELYILPSNNQ
ncbi:serine hydrolase domain-containing protein [Aliikangiella sp. IMCC44359]|uniref:serine hydrolase domain-containing protein n=1 Tax=Aliikangiella sp. IMCC44359 TaxID=3459125 RepID=UPI00403AEA93